jgi:hypothetical protein
VTRVIQCVALTVACVGLTVAAWRDVGVCAEREDPLFGHTNDPAAIQTQLRLAVPQLEKGLRLLQSSSDPDQISVALDALFDSYRYLRAAQESSDNLNNNSRFPDPMVQLRNQRVWRVRSHLIKCRSGFVPGSEGIAMCTEEASAALRELRIILQVFP